MKDVIDLSALDSEVREKSVRLLPTNFSGRSYTHFVDSIGKRPRFVDALFGEEEKEDAEYLLERARHEVDYLAKHNWLSGDVLAHCALDEAQLAHAQGDKTATISHLYDAVAVIMRMISVIEDRQNLGGDEK